MPLMDKLKKKGRLLTFIFAGVSATFVHSPSRSNGPSSSYPERSERVKDCTWAGQPVDDVPGLAFDLWRNLETMKVKSPTIGRPLYDYAAEADIRYCPMTLSKIAATYNPRDGVIDASLAKDKRRPFLAESVTLVQARETRRAMLGWNDEEAPGATIYERQKRLLARKAADDTLVRLTIIDLVHAGRTEIIPFLEKETLLTDAFHQAEARGVVYEEALAAAGAAVMEDLLRDQSWLDFHNDRLLAIFLVQAAGDRLQAPTPDTFSFAEYRRTGYVSDDFNFTATLAPMTKDLLGDNARMREAFAYLDARHRGADTSNNPYNGLEPQQILNAWGKNQSILETMDALSNRAPLQKKQKPAKKAARQQNPAQQQKG